MRISPMIRTALALTSAAAIALMAGCSGKPPEISRVFGQVLLVHDLQHNSYTEKLSVFVVANDPDGMDDLTNMYVINDDAELFWTVDSKSWLSSTAEGESWIGTNALSLPDGAPLPGGTYRIVLEDAGGDTAEESFTLPEERMDPSRIGYPSVSAAKGSITVSASGYTKPEMWIYTRDGRFLMRLSMASDPQPLTWDGLIASYPVLSQGFTYWVYAYDVEDEYGVLSGPSSSASLAAQ